MTPSAPYVLTLSDAGHQVRFTGGQHHTLTLPRPLTATEQHTTDPATVQLIDELLNDHTFNEIAADLRVTPQTIGKWRRRGLITGRRTSGRGECLFHPGQHRPGPAEQTAARRPAGTRHLLTSRQLAATLGVTSSTILRWTQLGLLTVTAPDNRGFGLYQPGQPRPTRDQITTACRPPGTGDAITGGQLAARHGVSRSAVYKWHQLELIRLPRHRRHRPEPLPPRPAGTQPRTDPCRPRRPPPRRRKMSDPGAIISPRRQNTPDHHTRNRIINTRCSVKPDRSSSPSARRR